MRFELHPSSSTPVYLYLSLAYSVRPAVLSGAYTRKVNGIVSYLFTFARLKLLVSKYVRKVLWSAV
jgi:hypothetical protein